MSSMALTARKLDVKIGDLVEIEGRKYDVVADERGASRSSLRSHFTVAEMLAERGERMLSREEFEARFGPIPSDDEG